jgi:hypothetical protein
VGVIFRGWDLERWSERCASVQKVTGSNPSAGCESHFHSDLLLTVGVGLGRVVRKVRQHPDDHEFKSQRWQ